MSRVHDAIDIWNFQCKTFLLVGRAARYRSDGPVNYLAYVHIHIYVAFIVMTTVMWVRQFSRDRGRGRIDEAEVRQGRGRGRLLEAEARPRQNVRDRGKAVRKPCK